MKTPLTPLFTTLGAKQITVVVALIATAFVVVQASSTSRNTSSGIDDYAELANTVADSNGIFSPSASSEPAAKFSSDLSSAAPLSGISEQAGPVETNAVFDAHPSGLRISRSDRMRSAETGLIASTRQVTRHAPAVGSIGKPANFSSPSGAPSVNGALGGVGSSGAVGGVNPSSAVGSAASNTTRTNPLASTIPESSVASTPLLNTDRPTPAAIGDLDRNESSGNLASNPLDFSSAMEDRTLDLMGMKIADLEPSSHSAVSSEGDGITPVAAVPEAGDTLWLLSAAMIGLVVYGQRSSSCRDTTK